MTAKLQEIVGLARQVGHVFMATADSNGMPHVATAGRLSQAGEDRLIVSAWCCPGTLANLKDNGSISLVVWDASGDAGWQVLGQVERVEDFAVMDGYDPALPQAPLLPQVQQRIILRPMRVIRFSQAPHSDVEE